jgi:beta-glucanase (GH16 family)
MEMKRITTLIKRNISVVTIITLLFSCQKAEVVLESFSTPISNPQNWKVTFQDEFSNDSLFVDQTSSFWLTGFPWGQSSGNREYMARYNAIPSQKCETPQRSLNISSTGTLEITARKDPGSYETWHWDKDGNFYTQCMPFNYTSGMLFSRQKFLYGYYEIRAKIPNQGEVFWPAFWLWAADDDKYREIDIFEFCCNNKNTVGFNMHNSPNVEGGYVHTVNDGKNNNYPSEYILPTSDNVTDFWHTYSVLWTADEVVWFVDNEPRYVVKGHSPKLDMHLILNSSFASWWPAPSDDILPGVFEIDYVRVWARK